MAGLPAIFPPPCFIQRFLLFRPDEATKTCLAVRQESILFATISFTKQKTNFIHCYQSPIPYYYDYVIKKSGFVRNISKFNQ